MSNVVYLSLDENKRLLERLAAPVKQKDHEDLAAIRRADARRNMERNAGFAHIPARYIGKTFDNYQADTPEQAAALQVCRNYARNIAAVLENGSSLTLYGRNGTGKTHLACAIIHRLYEIGYDGIYTTHEALRAHLRASYDQAAEQREADALKAFLAPSVLVLDELEKAKGNPDTIRKDLHRLIDDRYSNLKPTVVISRLNVPALKLYLGPDLWDRLTGRDHLSCLVKMDWESYRLPQ